MFTKLARYREFGRRHASATTLFQAFPVVNRLVRPVSGGASPRRHERVVGHWHTDAVTGKPECVWLVERTRIATVEMEQALSTAMPPHPPGPNRSTAYASLSWIPNRDRAA